LAPHAGKVISPQNRGEVDSADRPAMRFRAIQ